MKDTLLALVSKYATAWAGVVVEPSVFVAHVTKVLAEGVDPETALATLHGEDLYLACALSLGDPRAMAAFEARFLPEVAGYVAQIDRNPSFADDVRQNLREKLFVAEAGDAPKIAEYTGRGPLGAWLRISSVRIALNLRRRAKHNVEPDVEGGPQLRAPGPDPEIDYLKSRYRREFREAFQATITSLTGDERTVLRMHYIDGLTIDQIGGAYRVHRSTVARWLALSRDKIMEETKRLLTERLKVAPSEVDSLIGLVRSQLDVSIYKYLKDTHER